MSIEAWWPRLSRSTQQWLEDNNGDLVPEDVVAEITEAGGAIAPDAWWIGEVHEQGITLSDDAVDWVEAIANAETPEPPPSPLAVLPL